ncbi:MAG: polyphenol oxidase [Gammaproteobacteria bacterium]|nr:polyphenol oxidase [Gammaproteobacteria bacterium]
MTLQTQNGFVIAGGPPRFLHHPATSAIAPHGFFSAADGHSSGIYESLNCGFGSADDHALVSRNRAAAAGALALASEQLAAVYQVHGVVCLHTDAPAPEDHNAMPRADGMVTTRHDLALTILTADCLPLLLTDAAGAVIGACHAGWRGAVSGIVAATVNAMRHAHAGDIIAVMGPTIRQPSYQVGAERREEALALMPEALQDQAAGCFAADGADHFRFDLPALVRHQLLGCDVRTIHDCGIDTYGDADDAGKPNADSLPFFSHRRATHDHLPDSGRQISIIRRGPVQPTARSGPR